MYKNLVARCACALAAASFLSPFNTLAQTSAPPLRAAFVYVAPLTEAGWVRQHELGRQAVQAALGGLILLTYNGLSIALGNAPKSADALAALTRRRASLADSGQLDEVLSDSQVVFVFASVTSENEGFIGKREFAMMKPGAAFLLMSRAAVVDFPAMIEAAQSGHIQVATDVFPEEPVAADDPVRQASGILLSAHRTGGTRD